MNKKSLRYQITKLKPAEGDVFMVNYPASFNSHDVARLSHQMSDFARNLPVKIHICLFPAGVSVLQASTTAASFLPPGGFSMSSTTKQSKGETK